MLFFSYQQTPCQATYSTQISFCPSILSAVHQKSHSSVTSVAVRASDHPSHSPSKLNLNGNVRAQTRTMCDTNSGSALRHRRFGGCMRRRSSRIVGSVVLYLLHLSASVFFHRRIPRTDERKDVARRAQPNHFLFI